MKESPIHVLSRAIILDRGHILLCQTNDLPANFYFPPGGHVEPGESVEETLKREIREETGAVCTLKRFLGCLEYSFEPGHSSICHTHEYTFFFEGESEALKFDIPLVCLEKHLDLQWVPLSEVERIDCRPEPLKLTLREWLNASHNKAFRREMRREV